MLGLALVPAAAAWAVLAFAAGSAIELPLCLGSGGGALSGVTASLEAAVLTADPARLAGEWAVMVVAMMFPTLVAPLGHLAGRSFRRRLWRSVALFLAGYLSVWLAAGVLAAGLVLTGRAVLDGLGLPAVAGHVGCGAAALWQLSPAKRRALSRCRARPALPASGRAADRAALGFGLVYGGWCLRSCFALMVPPLLGGAGLLTTYVVMALILAERSTEHPSARNSAVVLVGLGLASVLGSYAAG